MAPCDTARATRNHITLCLHRNDRIRFMSRIDTIGKIKSTATGHKHVDPSLGCSQIGTAQLPRQQPRPTFPENAAQSPNPGLAFPTLLRVSAWIEKSSHARAPLPSSVAQPNPTLEGFDPAATEMLHVSYASINSEPPHSQPVVKSISPTGNASFHSPPHASLKSHPQIRALP